MPLSWRWSSEILIWVHEFVLDPCSINWAMMMAVDCCLGTLPQTQADHTSAVATGDQGGIIVRCWSLVARGGTLQGCVSRWCREKGALTRPSTLSAVPVEAIPKYQSGPAAGTHSQRPCAVGYSPIHQSGLSTLYPHAGPSTYHLPVSIRPFPSLVPLNLNLEPTSLQITS